MVQDDDQSGILVSSDLDPFIIDEGGSSSYKVRLRSIPSSNVTVTISGQGNLLTVDTDPSTPNMNESAITFTTTDWNVEKTVIVSGEEDADALDATVTLTHTATSSDLSYNAITEEFSVGIKDDEAGKIVVNTDSDPLEVNEGEAKAYTVQLSSLPSSEVTVTITGQGSEVAIDTDGNTDGDQSTLVFGISTWNSAQSVTVTGSEDSDGNNESLTLTHTAASTDQNFNDTKEDVIVTVVDDDAVGIELTPSSIAVTEEASNSYQVELSTEPSENVMVTITGVETGITLDNDNNPETPFTSLIFLTGSWNVAQTVTVSVANDDNADNELITLTHTATSQDTQYNNLTKELEVNVTDNDAAGLSAPQTLSVNEGETSEFAVSLSSVPTADVTVQITGSQGSDLTITPSSLTFTAQSWSTGQDVSVVAGQDNDLLDDEVVITLAASGGGFVNVTHQITVTVDDDDTAGVVILPATNPFTLAEGGNTSYTIQLRSAPSADVEVTLSGQGRKLIVDMDPSTPNTNESRITFTGVSWGSARTINIISEEDDDAQDERITLIHTTSSSDETYNALTQQLIVQVIDDEEIGIFVRSNPDPLEVNEGEDQTYSVQLGSAPSENVVITITGQRGQLSVDTDAVESGAQSILIFTSASWNIAQQVTIIGPQDDDASNETLTLTHTSTSGDASYNNLTQALAVVITDDDEEDIVVSPISVAVTEELTTSYEVALASEPLADVTVQISGQGTTLSLDDDNDPNTEFSSLVYTSNNWNQPQPITVTALSDNNTDDEVILLTHTATSPDAGYNNLVKELEINVTDKDAIGLSAPLTLSVNEGASGQFSVSLSSEPTSQVMVDISGYQGTDLTVDPSILVFDVENWSQQQRVNVEAGEDNDTQNDEFDLTLIANGGGLINVIHELSVIVIDDDEGAIIITYATDPLQIIEGEEGAYSVTLASEPLSSVEIMIGGQTSDLSTDVNALEEGNQSRMTFTQTNWSDPQSVVILSGEDDDALDETITLSHTSSSTDPKYDSLIEELTVTVLDNETAELQIISALDSLIVDEGKDATYQIRLGSAPTSSVRVNMMGERDQLLVDGNSVAEGNQNLLVFTSVNWNSLQNVTVKARHDDDARNDTLRIEHVLTSSDSDYDALMKEFFVVVIDDEKPTLRTTASSDSLNVNEGESLPLRINLSTEPSANVQVTTESFEDLTVYPETLTFSAENWDRNQPVNVIAGNDLDAVNDTVTVVLSASGAEYDEVVSLISIAIIDDETREIFVTPFDIEIPEGTSSQIKVRLTSEPTSDVIVDIVQEDDLTPSPSFLTFARLDWDTAQPVILTAREDDDQENDRETLLLTASGGDYEDVNKELTITIEDTDVAGISVFPSVLTVSEESSIELSAILNTEPSGDVRLLIPSMGDVVPTPKILTFTSRNWDVLQQVTLTASHDEDEENDRELLTIISSGANYGGYTQDVLVNIVDNDLSTIDLTPDPAPSEEEETTGTIEEGGTAEFDIVLREQPSGDVVVEIASSDESLAVMPSRLTFMPSNWNVEQTVMMISAEDDNDENEEVTVTLMASGGGYGRLSQTRRFTIRDQTAVSVQHSESHPVSVQLWGNYPNPFSTMTNVAFDLPEPAQISLIVTDLLGRTVILIPDHWYGVGQHQTLQIQGGELPSGVYYYRLDVKIDGKITGHTKPMMIIR